MDMTDERNEAMKSDIVDIEGRVHAKTDRAILFSTDGDREEAVWLPLAHVEISELRRGVGVVSMPEWLAVDRGLI